MSSGEPPPPRTPGGPRPRGPRSPLGLAGDPTGARALRADLFGGLARAWKGWIALVGLLLLGWLVLTLGSNLPADPRPEPGRRVGVDLDRTTVGVGGECLDVEVADTPAERQAGLRGRSTLGDLDGMLFVNDGPVSDAYTMSGVKFPLTIAFFDDQGVLVDRYDAEPCAGSVAECTLYEPSRPYVQVVEVAAGTLPVGDVGACLGGEALGRRPSA